MMEVTIATQRGRDKIYWNQERSHKMVYLIFEKHIGFWDEKMYKIIPSEKQDEQKKRIEKKK